MRLVGLMAAAVRIFMYGKGRSVGFVRNNRLGLGFGLPRCLLWGFYWEGRVHWDRRWWSHVGPKVLNKLLQIHVERFSWQVEMVRSRVGVGG